MRVTKCWCVPALLIVMYLSGSSLFAQNTNSGNIRGTVTDPTGAVIPGVTVTVKDIDKGVVKTFTTDGAGLYDTGSIVPDHYLITFTKEGFTTFERGPITLDVSIQTINGQLKVGSQTQRIVVNTDVPLLTTESGAQEATLTSDVMEQLPQTNLGADWEVFTVLLPGAAGSPENANSASNPGQVAAINGNLPFESVLADGATTTLPQSTNSDVTVFETTSEVKISTNGFSAQYGQGGIVYNQITKGGTSQFHGAGYEYFSNNALNAFPYEFGTTGVQLPELRFNNFGVAVGGPVIPHKLFFYFDFDKTINNTVNVNHETLPLGQNAAMANGDFTAPGMPTIYDPTTQTIQYTGSHTYQSPAYITAQNPAGQITQACPCVIRTSFADEYGNGNRIPANMINPVAKNFQNLLLTLGQGAVEQPANVGVSTTVQGVVTNNYAFNTPGINPFTKFFGRMDYDLASNNRVTVSVTESDNPGFDFGSTVCPLNCANEDVSRVNSQISDVWNYSPTLVNEARIGFTDQLNFFNSATLGQGYNDKAGFKLARGADIIAPFGPGSNMTGFSDGADSPFTYKEFVYDPSDVVTLIRGRHILHFGGEFLISLADSTQYGYINPGTPSFDGNYTSAGGQITKSAGQGDGIAYADFLLGQMNSFSASDTPEYGGRTKSPQLFLQDDWKFRPNLTVNLGLRWQAHTGWTEVKGNESSFDPTVVNPANNSLGAIWYGTTQANGRGRLIAPDYNIWMPRVGFSYQPKNNTVIRGGVGVYASTLSVDTYAGGGLGTAFGSSGNTSDTTNGICPVAQIDSDGSTPDMTDPGCGVVTNGTNFNTLTPNAAYLTAPTTPDARNGQGVNFVAFHTPLPKNLQWNVSLERQFGQNYVATLTYVGNHGYDLTFNNIDINQVPENKLSANDLGDRPYPLFNGITGETNNAISNYNALQAVLTKRMSYGLQLSINYTWSHFLDDLDSSGWGSREGFQNYQNAFNPADNYSNGNFDIRNMFKGQAIYQLPFGKGRQFLNNNLLLDELLGGWQVSSVWVVEGGNPIGITTGGNNSSNNQSGSYTQEANLVPGQSLHLPGSTKSRLGEWYNLNALAVPAPFTYGNFLRNTVYGPGVVNVAASLGKTFDIWPERGVKMQIRADAGNVLNHPSFGQPGNNAIGPGETANITSTTVGGRQIQLYGRISF
jgi:hypothetical protein